MSVLKREYGKEQPYIGCGMFKIRLPLIHFRFTGPEAITGLCNSVTSLAAIATLVGILGIEDRQAWAVIVFSCLAYCLHWLLGDATVGGWITPALALVIVWGSDPKDAGHVRPAAGIGCYLYCAGCDRRRQEDHRYGAALHQIRDCHGDGCHGGL